MNRQDRIDEALELFAPDATEFQKIAIADALAAVERIVWPPKTRDEEEAFRRLGAMVWEVLQRR